MKNLSMATIGAALFALGTVGAVPASAGNLIFDYEAQVSGSAALNSLLIPIAEQYLGLPTGTISPFIDFPAYTFTGQFTVLDDPAQYTDGDITLDSTFFSSLYSFPFPPSVVDTLDSVFNLDFFGTGSVTSNSGTTSFVFEYINQDNSILINQFTDVSVLNGCLVGECVTTVGGSFNLDLVLSEFLAEIDEDGVDLPPEITQALIFYQEFIGNELNVVAGNVDLEVTTVPVESVPEPSTLLGLFGLGSFFAAKRKLQKAA